MCVARRYKTYARIKFFFLIWVNQQFEPTRAVFEQTEISSDLNVSKCVPPCAVATRYEMTNNNRIIVM